jgi:hypothetical protein
MRRALHLGVQKALGVMRSHYEINFEAVAEGYIVPEGVEDEVAMERVDQGSRNQWELDRFGRFPVEPVRPGT